VAKVATLRHQRRGSAALPYRAAAHLFQSTDENGAYLHRNSGDFNQISVIL
jgi:hypothetical protein